MKKLVFVVLVIINIANAESSLDMMLRLKELERQAQEHHRYVSQAREKRQKELLRSVVSALRLVRYSKTQQEQRLGIKLLRNVAWETTDYANGEIYERYGKNGKSKILIVNETQDTIEMDKFPKIKENLGVIMQIASGYIAGDYYTRAGLVVVFKEVVSFLKEYDELAKQDNK